MQRLEPVYLFALEFCGELFIDIHFLHLALFTVLYVLYFTFVYHIPPLPFVAAIKNILMDV